jgi:predicted metal-dependent hydrolase
MRIALKEMTLELRKEDAVYQLSLRCQRYRNARNLRLRVLSDRELSLTMPWYASEKAIRAFINERSDWILENIARQSRATTAIHSYMDEHPMLSADGKNWRIELAPIAPKPILFYPSESVAKLCVMQAGQFVFKRFIVGLKSIIQARTIELANRCALSVQVISVRNQRSRWGSCSSKGNVSLNWRICLLPPNLMDYVILHELAHLRHRNHSQQYWDFLTTLDPDALAHDREINRIGRPLMMLKGE